MKTVWVSGLPEEKAEEVRREFASSAIIRARLSEILNQKAKTKRTEALSSSTYDSPSWAYFQADVNGYERAINEVISLLEK